MTLTAVAITLADRQPEAGFTLDYTVATADGTATEPSDYEAVSQSVSIPSSAFTVDTSTGQTRWRATRTYTALIQDDTVDEIRRDPHGERWRSTSPAPPTWWPAT